MNPKKELLWSLWVWTRNEQTLALSDRKVSRHFHEDRQQQGTKHGNKEPMALGPVGPFGAVRGLPACRQLSLYTCRNLSSPSCLTGKVPVLFTFWLLRSPAKPCMKHQLSAESLGSGFQATGLIPMYRVLCQGVRLTIMSMV